MQDKGASIPFFVLRSHISKEPSSNSAQIAQSHGRLSEQRVEVTGSCLLINPYSSMPDSF